MELDAFSNVFYSPQIINKHGDVRYNFIRKKTKYVCWFYRLEYSFNDSLEKNLNKRVIKWNGNKPKQNSLSNNVFDCKLFLSIHYNAILSSLSRHEPEFSSDFNNL